MTNGQEEEDGTDPQDPCDFDFDSQDLGSVGDNFLQADCDGDGIVNGDELDDNDGDGIPDLDEPNNGDQTIQDDLEPFDIMTPNGDGLNDVFVIRGIDRFPNNTVRIYNRWGVEVWGGQGYGQNGVFFRGESNGRITLDSDELLPVGTYYYVIDYTNNEGIVRSLAGPLYINR